MYDMETYKNKLRGGRGVERVFCLWGGRLEIDRVKWELWVVSDEGEW